MTTHGLLVGGETRITYYWPASECLMARTRCLGLVYVQSNSCAAGSTSGEPKLNPQYFQDENGKTQTARPKRQDPNGKTQTARPNGKT